MFVSMLLNTFNDDKTNPLLQWWLPTVMTVPMRDSADSSILMLSLPPS